MEPVNIVHIEKLTHDINQLAQLHRYHHCQILHAEAVNTGLTMTGSVSDTATLCVGDVSQIVASTLGHIENNAHLISFLIHEHASNCAYNMYIASYGQQYGQDKVYLKSGAFNGYDIGFLETELQQLYDGVIEPAIVLKNDSDKRLYDAYVNHDCVDSTMLFPGTHIDLCEQNIDSYCKVFVQDNYRYSEPLPTPTLLSMLSAVVAVLS